MIEETQKFSGGICRDKPGVGGRGRAVGPIGDDTEASIRAIGEAGNARRRQRRPIVRGLDRSRIQTLSVNPPPLGQKLAIPLTAVAPAKPCLFSSRTITAFSLL
jgi:hypothetical protein